MCGLAGLFILPDSPQPLPDFNLALSAMKHRGPDDEGFLAFNTVTTANSVNVGEDLSAFNLFLAFKRLSIIDLSSAGHQPMISKNGRFFMVFNGEIYNYKELKSELSDVGVPFFSETDSEVLLNAWIQWGSAVLPRLIGMFSFAIYDQENKKLTLGRDAFGVKPLFYSISNDKVAFASEIDTLKCLLPDLALTTDYQEVYNYLVWGNYDESDRSFSSELKHLPPAHLLEISLNTYFSFSISSWWKPSIKENKNISFADAALHLRELFLHSVKLHIRSDVPIGAALSGGIDSSAIVCAMRYVAPDLPIHTFSYIAANKNISEEYWVDKVNENVKAISHKVSIDEPDILKDMDNIISLQGEPFGSTSIYAQYRIYQEAKREGIKVILDGQGADELLAGYSGYPAERLKSLWEKGKVMDILDFLFYWSKWPGRGFKAAMTQLLGLLVPPRLKKLAHKWNGKNTRPVWLNTEFLTREGVQFALPGIVKRSPENRGRRVPETLRHLFLHGNLISLLRHADRNSMHWSVESRVPFLTIPMAEFLLSLPESFLIDQKGRTKSVFREAMRGIVPDEILDRKDKIGFATPEKDWLFSEEFNLLARLSCLNDLPFIHKVGVEKYIDDLKSGKRKFDFTSWRLLNFSKWTEKNMSVNQVNQKG